MRRGIAGDLEGDRRGDETLVDVIRRRASQEPDRIAFTFLRDGEDDEVTVRYGELDGRARAVAAVLDRVAQPPVSALLVCESGPEFVVGLLGCLYAGVVAVPVHPPDGRDLEAVGRRFRRVADDASAGVLLTAGKAAARLERGGMSCAARVAIDEIAIDEGVEWRPRRRNDLAFLQYTSGSTGSPRGVMVTHANIVAHGSSVASVLRLTPDAVAVSWLPAYHDMGLIGTLLIPLQIGFRTVQLSPLHFLERPVRWLRAITKYRGTLSPAPNFAYDLVARKTTAADRRGLALDCWRAAMNGAEPIRAHTCERFAATFAECGFRREAFVPCYGLAEATLMVAGGPLGAGPVRRVVDGRALDGGEVTAVAPQHADARTIVASGAPLPGLEVWIAHPDEGTRLPPGRVGEIRIAGPSVTRGYWERPEDTARAFGAANEGERSLRTGDLGFVSDGLLFVTGRCKDLIVVRGRNHHPHDLEDTAASAHPAARFGGGAAFAVDGADGERVVLVQESDTDDTATLGAIVDAIRESVRRAHGLALAAVILIPPRTLPKTTSGKVRRHACRELLRAGRLPMLLDGSSIRQPEVRVASEPRDIETALREIVAGLRDLTPGSIPSDAALATLGVDSAEAAEVAVALEERLGRRVPLTVLMEQPTIAAVAAALCGVGS